MLPRSGQEEESVQKAVFKYDWRYPKVVPFNLMEKKKRENMYSPKSEKFESILLC